VPDKRLEFLGYRVFTAMVAYQTLLLSRRIKSYNGQQANVAFLMSICALFISVMAYRAEGMSSPYYAGLNLVAIASLAFFPWSKAFYFINPILIYAPFYLLALFASPANQNWKSLAINSFFIFSTIVISIITRLFNEKLRTEEIKSRMALNQEVTNRDKIIAVKSKEAIDLGHLSQQFSPQVVNSIKSGEIKITDGVKRTKICAMFIDIVNSTERVVRIDQEKVNRVITMFLEDTTKYLLKYDITIDKFLGDGIFAFSNAPISYNDYADRCLRAGWEILAAIQERSFEYEKNWHQKLEIRIGISVGYANIGFYGPRKHFHSYTAIGPAVNLSSRLCGAGPVDGIIVDHDVIEALRDREHFKFEALGDLKLKGFESDIIKCYQMKDLITQGNTEGLHECPTCTTIMYLDNDANGFFVFKCRSCGSVAGQPESQASALKAA
jgi:adenylate cyclase